MSRRVPALAAILLTALIVSAAPPTVRVDDASAAIINRTSLRDATGFAPLPRGVLIVDKAPTLTFANVGLTLMGDETTIRSNLLLGGFIERSALLIRCGEDGLGALSNRFDETPAKRGTVLEAGEVGWHFDGNANVAVGGVVTRILPGQRIPQSLEFIRAFKGIPFTTGKTEFDLGAGHGCAVGEDIWATDGPAINEIVGEFRRVVAATERTITLDQPLVRTYKQGTFVRGKFPARMALSGMTLQGQLGSVILQQAVDISIADCVVPIPDACPPEHGMGRFSLYGCGRIDVRRCKLRSGVGVSHGCGAAFTGCDATHICGEQNQTHVTIDNCRVNWIDAWQQCTKWTVRNSTIADWLGVYDDWVLEDCFVFNGPIRVRGQNAVVRRVKTNGPIIVQRDYPTSHAGSSTNVTLQGVDGAYIELLPGTSGKILDSTAPVICRDAATKANWTRDGKPLP